MTKKHIGLIPTCQNHRYDAFGLDIFALFSDDDGAGAGEWSDTHVRWIELGELPADIAVQREALDVAAGAVGFRIAWHPRVAANPGDPLTEAEVELEVITAGYVDHTGQPLTVPLIAEGMTEATWADGFTSDAWRTPDGMLFIPADPRDVSQHYRNVWFEPTGCWVEAVTGEAAVIVDGIPEVAR